MFLRCDADFKNFYEMEGSKTLSEVWQKSPSSYNRDGARGQIGFNSSSNANQHHLATLETLKLLT